MASISKYLKYIYPDESTEALQQSISDLVDSWKSIIHSHPFKLNETDIVLITYADQINDADKFPLTSLKNWLDDNQDVGISWLHLLPFYPYSSDDGFSVINYKEVDPKIGTWKEIGELGQNHGLVFDAVINHSSKSNAWFRSFLAEEKEYKDFYVSWKDQWDTSQVVRPRISPLFHRYNAKRGSICVWTTFSEDQVDLNFKNPQVLIKILDTLLFYVSKGARILRLDAVGFMWKESGTSCIHLSETHALIKLMRLVLRSVQPDLLLLTETNVPHRENVSYFGNGDEADMVYNFTLPPLTAYTLLSGNTLPLSKWLSELKVPYDTVCFFNFLASHDGVGVRPVLNILDDADVQLIVEAAKANGGLVSYKAESDGTSTPYEINSNYLSLLCGPEKDIELGLKRFLLAHGLLLAMPGLPALYFHSLVGSLNDIEGMQQSGIRRRINRQRLNTKELNEKLFDEKSLQYKIFSSLKQMIRVRKAQSAFDPYAKFKADQLQPGIIRLIRTNLQTKDRLVCVFNFSDQKKSIALKDIENPTDVLHGVTLLHSLSLLPYTFYWIKEQ